MQHVVGWRQQRSQLLCAQDVQLVAQQAGQAAVGVQQPALVVDGRHHAHVVQPVHACDEQAVAFGAAHGEAHGNANLGSGVMGSPFCGNARHSSCGRVQPAAPRHLQPGVQVHAALRTWPPYLCLSCSGADAAVCSMSAALALAACATMLWEEGNKERLAFPWEEGTKE